MPIQCDLSLENTECCLAKDLALPPPSETSGGTHPRSTARCRLRPRKTSVITVSWGCWRQGRTERERSLQDERTLATKALLWKGL